MKRTNGYRTYLPGLVASIGMLLASIPAGAQTRGIEDGTTGRIHPIPVDTGKVATLRGRLMPVEVQEAGGAAAGCPVLISTHTDASFEGGSYFVQAGFAETEIAAASYTIPASAFPIQLDLAEMIFATSGTSEQTTTMWSFLVWEGTPATGTLIGTFSSDDLILPHLVMPPGTNGVNIQVSVDPGDPDQIIITDDGSHTFSIGYRIDEHNQPSQNPCSLGPPTCCNAFPVTDTGPVASLGGNWLFGLNCGPLGCPSGGGWASFGQLPLLLCRPSGDWVMRASWHSFNCNPGAGACCLPDGACQEMFSDDCAADGGTYQGDNELCAQTNCPQPLGACCVAIDCVDAFEQNCLNAGGTWHGPGSDCTAVNCDPPGACCFDGGSCANLTESQCAIAGGAWASGMTECATWDCNPSGACCLLDGSCGPDLSADDCAAQGGAYQGNGTTCAGVTCPDAVGACCLAGGACFEGLTEVNCLGIPGATWAGPGSGCSACAADCPQDIDGSGDVGFNDLLAILSNWGPCASCPADIDESGDVGFTDLLAVLTWWGPCP